MSELLTESRLKCARACPRLHRIKYVLGYRPRQDADNLRFGTLIHKMLEAWWLMPPEMRLAAAFDAIPEGTDPVDRVRAEEMLRGYDARWSLDAANYEVLAVEAQFDTELRNPTTGRASRTFRLGGKVDVIVRDLRDGRTLIVEHKTSSEQIGPGSEYWRRLRMDGQVSVYFEGGRSLGHDVQGCLYDILGKPKLSPHKATPMETRKYTQKGTIYSGQREEDEGLAEFRERIAKAIAEDPNRFYQRGEVVRLEEELEEARFDIWQTGQAIHDAETAGRAPRNPDACVRYNRTCEYFDVCTGVASLEDPALFVQSSDVHPELSAESPKEEGHA